MSPEKRLGRNRRVPAERKISPVPTPEEILFDENYKTAADIVNALEPRAIKSSISVTPLERWRFLNLEDDDVSKQFSDGRVTIGHLKIPYTPHGNDFENNLSVVAIVNTVVVKFALKEDMAPTVNLQNAPENTNSV